MANTNTSILDWVTSQMNKTASKEPEKSKVAFTKIFTKTAKDRGCTQDEIDRLIKEINDAK